MCIRIHIGYVRSCLAIVVFSIVNSDSKRWPGNDINVKENICPIFVYIAANFRISYQITTKRSNIQNVEYELNIRPSLIIWIHLQCTTPP